MAVHSIPHASGPIPGSVRASFPDAAIIRYTPEDMAIYVFDLAEDALGHPSAQLAECVKRGRL